jgi:hypothetical protein
LLKNGPAAWSWFLCGRILGTLSILCTKKLRDATVRWLAISCTVVIINNPFTGMFQPRAFKRYFDKKGFSAHKSLWLGGRGSSVSAALANKMYMHITSHNLINM